MGEQIVCSNCLSNADSGLPACPYCGQSFENTNPAGTLPVNTLLAGRYTIGRVLALDGEGVLYAAIDNSATRRVVIKEYVPVTICAARSRDGSVIPRQGREVLFKTTRMDFVDLYRSLVALGRNDGLVQVLDLIEENNTAYAVREPDEGTPLLTYLEQRAQPLTQSEALLLLRPVVYGVEAMHRMGLLHRGISPETVFITKTGSAKLSGYATLGLRTADSELKSQMFDGYAAPEQYAVAEFDGKYTDIYGLGALFYRVLTGKTPVPANLRRMNDTLPPAHTVDKEIPGFVSAAIARAMRLAPGERMQSASDLLAAITAPEKRHLLYENYHPLFIYRQRMSKQADAIMGMMLYSALFTDEELLRNYDFYQTVTLHHSSLSTCIFGILASRIGRHDDAYTYFAQSARMDLDDYHDNFYAGIHAANMAGTWQSIVFGFAGLRLVNGVPEFKFYIPEEWNGYHFTVKIKESVLAVDVLPDGWTITLQSGDAVNFLVEGKPYELTEKGATCHEAL